MNADTRTRLASERMIGEAIVDVASELRLLEIAELVSMIRADQSVNIADLIHSSSELYFKPGTLRYMSCGHYLVQWNNTPAITLVLEFRQSVVRVLFSLSIGCCRASVDILEESYGPHALDANSRIVALTEAIRNARVTPAAAWQG